MLFILKLQGKRKEAKDASYLCQIFGAESELEMSDEAAICRAGNTWHGGNMQAIKPTLCSGPFPDSVIMKSHYVALLDWAAWSPHGGQHHSSFLL